MIVKCEGCGNLFFGSIVDKTCNDCDDEETVDTIWGTFDIGGPQCHSLQSPVSSQLLAKLFQ